MVEGATVCAAAMLVLKGWARSSFYEALITVRTEGIKPVDGRSPRAPGAGGAGAHESDMMPSFCGV